MLFGWLLDFCSSPAWPLFCQAKYESPLWKANQADRTAIFPIGTIERGGKNESHFFVYYECPAPDFALGGENFHNTSVEESYINQTEFIKSKFQRVP